MKKTYFKNIWREIRGSISRFLAIFCITALGVGFLAGLLSTTPDMRYSADAYYDNTRLMDIRLLSTMGFCDEDITAVAETEGILAAEGGRSVDLLVELEDGDTIVARVHGVDMDAQREGSAINQVELLEGRFPENPGECLVLLEKVPLSGTEVGKSLTFSADNADLEDTVTETELTVTGIVSSSYYMSLEREQADIGNGRLSMILFVPIELLNYDYYTEIYALTENTAQLQAFTDEYQDAVDIEVERLETLAETQVNVRRDQIIDEAQQELDEAREEYETQKADAERQLEEAWQEILNARAELAAGERDLSQARIDLRDGRAELEQRRVDGQAQLDASAAELEAGEAEYQAGLAQYEENRTQLEAARAELDAASEQIEQIRVLIAAGMPVSEEMQAAVDQYDASLAEVEAGEAQLEEARLLLEQTRTQLDEGQAALEQGRIDYENGIAEAERQLAQAERDIASGQAELEEGQAQLAEGEAEYESSSAEVEEQLLDAEYQIRDAEAAIADIETPSWYVLTREANVAYVSFESNAEKVANIARVFPFFFFLVALLVTLTTMTRMVEEQRTQIGTLKALGYSRGAIILKYMLYAGIAGVLGSAVGLAIGLCLFPAVIWNAYSIMYTLPDLIFRLNPQYALVSSLALILCAQGATLMACLSSLREQPALLMRPRAPKAGKRIFLEKIPFVWRRLKFTHKVTARNLIRYKKRFFMTVIGVAGCTALLLTGLGLRDSINDIVGKQFDELWLYNATVVLRHDGDDQNDFRVQRLLEGEDFESTLAVHSEAGHAQTDSYRGETTLFIPREQDRLTDFIVLRERVGHEPVAFDDEDAVVITEKLSLRLGAGAGDIIEVENADGERAEVTVTGVTENYVQSFVYMTAHAYQSAFGDEPEYTSVLTVTTAETDEQRDDLATRLLSASNIAGVQFTATTQESFEEMLQSINTIVAVIIVSAAALALVVLYNLTNINIAEREKELATIKVLGFTRQEVAAYIFRETNILAFFGTLCGLVLGIYLHAFVVQTAEVDMVMFGREIAPISYVLSAVLTMAFALLINLVMRRSLARINMVESLKAPE